MYTNCQENWYLIVTRSNNEKTIVKRFTQLGIESFLPLHKIVRQWSDRKKIVEVPLFPNYVFVRMSEKNRHSLFDIREMVRFVSFEKRPVIVKEKEIENIRLVLNEDIEVYDRIEFKEGQRVRICKGGLVGLEGTVIKQNNKPRLILAIDSLQKLLAINIPANYTEIISYS